MDISRTDQKKRAANAANKGTRLAACDFFEARYAGREEKPRPFGPRNYFFTRLSYAVAQTLTPPIQRLTARNLYSLKGGRAPGEGRETRHALRANFTPD